MKLGAPEKITYGRHLALEGEFCEGKWGLKEEGAEIRFPSAGGGVPLVSIRPVRFGSVRFPAGPVRFCRFGSDTPVRFWPVPKI